MPPAKSRPWDEGLDNFGENLVRLGTALKAISEPPAGTASDYGFWSTVGSTSAGFLVAFRQALPVLTRGERSFLQLVPTSEAAELYSHPREDSPQHAHTLLHEGVLACHEILSLLERINQTTGASPSGLREAMQTLIAELAESANAAGWEVRNVCHEFAAEVKLAGAEPANLEDLGPGAVGLIHDMAAAAHRLRRERRQWFRIEQRLKLTTESPTGAAGSRAPSS